MTNIDAWAVRAIVFQTFAGEGRAPSPREIARIIGCAPAEVDAALRDLGERHAIVLAPDGDAVRMAHPFSASPMGFVVAPLDPRDERRWWGGCAWDSFGISAALALDVRIDTSCPACAARLEIVCGPATPPPRELAIMIPAPAEHWWDDVVVTCSSIRLCCTTDHAKQWREHAGLDTGEVVAATTMWELAQPWYGDRLADDFTPHSREHNQALLERVGLTGGFWHLP